MRCAGLCVKVLAALSCHECILVARRPGDVRPGLAEPVCFERRSCRSVGVQRKLHLRRYCGIMGELPLAESLDL